MDDLPAMTTTNNNEDDDQQSTPAGDPNLSPLHVVESTPAGDPNSSSPGESEDSHFADDCEAIEKKYRRNGVYGSVWLSIVSYCASLLVFAFHLIHLEGLVSMGLSAGLTVYVYNVTESNIAFDGGVMSWTLLTFAVVTPLSSSIGMAFTRREKAISYFKTIRSTLVELYIAHATWDWPKRGKPETGRQASTDVDWLKYADSNLENMLGLVEELRMHLLLPTSSRARHKVTPNGIKEARAINEVAGRLHTSMVARMGEMSKQCEFLKLQGMPGNEASRIRQWEQFIVDSIEGLRLLKSYRTPQALRSYARILSVIVPPLFCPYYADLSRSTNSLGLGTFYSILTALTLTGLFECVVQLEDPFMGHASLDGVNVENELGPSLRDNLLVLRGQNFPDAPSFAPGSKYAFSYSLAANPGILRTGDVRLFGTKE